ncbi:armadillo-type protein [Mycena latifolia]|nr:armadillo-type protein [Mycena latifolia]
MPPLTRQQTLESVLSWWSDSNPPGPTINLHAAAKPLMRLMYRRQALGFVKRNNGVPLAQETLEIYWSYLLWKYVSTSTKIVILEELEIRARSEEDARVLINSNAAHKMLQLLRSSPFLRPWLTRIVRHLANHGEFITAQTVSEALVALLREVNDVGSVFEFKSEIADSQALAFVKRNHDIVLLPVTVEIYLSHILWKDVSTSTKITILEELETRALSEEDAWVLLHSNMVSTTLEFLRSSSYDMRWRLRRPSAAILRNVASHSKSTTAAVIEPLVALLRDSDVNDGKLAFYLLRSIADRLEGAEGVVAANALHYLLDGLGSPSPDVCEAACQLTEKLAEHQSTSASVIDLNPCRQLVALSSTVDTEASVALFASHALVAIASWADGAEAVVAAHVLDHVAKWFASEQHYWMRRSACQLLEKLARHKSTAEAVLNLKPCERLVTILQFSDMGTVGTALSAVASIANWPTGAEAAVAANVLDHITNRLELQWPRVRKPACSLVATLARHESTVQAVARAVPRKRLVALSRDEDEDVRKIADEAMRAIDDYLASPEAPMGEAGGPTINVV